MNAKPGQNRHAVTAPVIVPAHIARMPHWWSPLAAISGVLSAIGAWQHSPVLLGIALIGNVIVLVSYFPLRRRRLARIRAFVATELAARRKANP